MILLKNIKYSNLRQWTYTPFKLKNYRVNLNLNRIPVDILLKDSTLLNSIQLGMSFGIGNLHF